VATSNDEGPRKAAAVLGWFTVALMTAAAIAMLALLTGV
jgi:hypothetical protein